MPPPYKRRFLESRLAYRIQELALGGLKPATVERLEALGEQLDGGKIEVRRRRGDDRPIAGTRLIREYQGVEHCVHGARRWVRVPGPPLQIPVGHRARDHGNALERLGVLLAFADGRGPMKRPIVRKVRCAVYTRKSSEEGLDMEFNSLDAQRESCEAYIASQKPEGWILVPDRYDDGGFSGGTLERPALKRLLADIESGRIDVVVVYKIDRLSRSLMILPGWSRCFDRGSVTFVSVTQSFNTTTSMGR